MRRSISPVDNVNTPSIITEAGTVLAAKNAGNRRGWSIQNVGSNPIYVRLGGTASSSVFHYALKAGTADIDGEGGIVEEKAGAVYQGQITIAGDAQDAIKAVVLEYE